jgi:Uma2 family endonuclease
MHPTDSPLVVADAHRVVASQTKGRMAPMTVAARRVVLTFDVPWSHPDWVLEDDKVPASAAQDNAATVAASTWRVWAVRVQRNVQVRRELAVRWDPENPRVGVDPDVCVLDPPPDTPEAQLSSLRLWEPGTSPPLVALEVVSENNAEKDYGIGPRKHAASGVNELWVFDPHRFGPGNDGGPWVLQVWSRGKDGEFRRVYAGDGPAWSDVFGAWIVVSSDGMYVRLSDDEEGTRLWPTEAELMAQERAARIAALAEVERERAEKERERAEKERERAEKEAALARIAALEALLKKPPGNS